MGETRSHGRGLLPLLFVALVGCLLLAYLGSARDLELVMAPAASAAALAAGGICFWVLRVDSRLAAEEAAALLAAEPLAETVHSFARSGRSALLVFVRHDDSGRLVDACAWDPDDYF